MKNIGIFNRSILVQTNKFDLFLNQRKKKLKGWLKIPL